MDNLDSVFVVDEDLSARRGIARLLRAAGYDVRDFPSANEFCEALGDVTPGCAVLDAGFLEEVANELQTQIGAGGGDLPIIVVTTGDDLQTRQQAMRLNAIGLFRKPVDGAALLDAIGWTMQKTSNEETSESQQKV